MPDKEQDNGKHTSTYPKSAKLPRNVDVVSLRVLVDWLKSIERFAFPRSLICEILWQHLHPEAEPA